MDKMINLLLLLSQNLNACLARWQSKRQQKLAVKQDDDSIGAPLISGRAAIELVARFKARDRYHARCRSNAGKNILR